MSDIVMEIVHGTATSATVKCPNCGNKCFGVLARTAGTGTKYFLRCYCGVAGPFADTKLEAVEKFKQVFGPRK